MQGHRTDLRYKPHSAHWGVFSAAWDGRTLSVKPHPGDPDPNPLIENLPGALRHKARVTTPMVRKGWLERGPGADAMRGRDAFVPVSWPEVLDLLAKELQRVNHQHGPQAIFGGSYGWSSAGRFHHAQSQVHRFLNTVLGGYVRSVNNYSAGAALPLLPHVLASLDEVARRNVTWEQIVEHSEFVLCFGGMALKNSRVASGGVSRHIERDSMRAAALRGCRFISISPLRSDLPDEAAFDWLPVTPGTDTAFMLALVHALVTRGLHDTDFIRRCCDGWDTFEDYLLGRSDGTPKTAAWAAPLCGIAEDRITELALALAGRRVLVVVSHSLQRSEHGEQPVWMGAVLAAALGQLGLPGGGYNYALGTLAHYGRRSNAVPVGALPQGTNGVQDFIPVARISDMLLNPGRPFDYNGVRRRYPNIRLAYWAGGNPFHHHQDLHRLAEALRTLETFVVHEIAWTATARHADIVLPCTMTLEREDIGAAPTDPLMVAMHRIAEPHGQARDDYDIFCDLAERLGRLDEFSEGRTSREWLAHLYERTRKALEDMGREAPGFEAFWQRGEITLPQQDDDGGLLRAFREDPLAHPLPTPSGKVQISSSVVAGFGYPDCPGHPAWLPFKYAPTAEYPLWLVANQPHARLHSQLDFGGHSQASKRRGREVCTLHPAAAAARGIREGDIVRLHNEIGACLASAHLSADLREDVVQMATGAWHDPVTDEQGRPMCAHGNANVLTRDIGTSSLAQGCAGQLSTVQIERYEGVLPPIRAFDPPSA
ncbi:MULTISPECIES: molybdopterin-dependent oxidoreductase [unclassified Variovorax]|uniref:molybdopterin-dependent oxidoreductase n=1 Tax=unclassified Variovorax TaxID=663243 RepID=UPI00076BD896|nr:MULTISPECIES: molybdopterin-dependent oxidoreductase [unclassified Variovorax]KWT83588.1 Biotin sulfoxide reductase [Variovorax sp. WDL1]PNG51700.1 Dimethyl sulfoxide/trimethylamine N-oxide reductase [Variovorax sp. B2]PNG54048.1 Dimethyl sulfoxide/trimethylamine N-oxide reductase [Variovorax sp. B4]VTV11519.1 Dimethyl sulfoxide/trimethylamine N-oxide reductase precursor [Variovorax sp. WDL1]